MTRVYCALPRFYIGDTASHLSRRFPRFLCWCALKVRLARAIPLPSVCVTPSYCAVSFCFMFRKTIRRHYVRDFYSCSRNVSVESIIIFGHIVTMICEEIIGFYSFYFGSLNTGRFYIVVPRRPTVRFCSSPPASVRWPVSVATYDILHHDARMLVFDILHIELVIRSESCIWTTFDVFNNWAPLAESIESLACCWHLFGSVYRRSSSTIPLLFRPFPCVSNWCLNRYFFFKLFFHICNLVWLAYCCVANVRAMVTILVNSV